MPGVRGATRPGEDDHHVTFNLFSCPHCGNHLAQFVNATPHTINRDKTVACAGISDVHYHLLSADAFQLCNTLNTVNVTDQPVVVEGRLRVPYQAAFLHLPDGPDQADGLAPAVEE